MSQNTCRKAKVIRPEEGGSDPADKDPGGRRRKAPVESFWACILGFTNMETYNKLKKAAVQYTDDHVVPRMHQILVFLTKSDRIEVFINDLSFEREASFIAAQKEPLKALLCCWHNGDIDVPSHRIRQGLLELFTENEDTDIYLKTGKGQATQDFVIRPRKLSTLEGK